MARPSLSTIFTAQDLMTPQIKKMQDSVSKFSENIQKMNKSSESSFLSLRNVISAGLIVAGLKKIVQSASEMQDAKTNFEVLTGSMERAEAVVSRLKKLGAETPFEFKDLSNATKVLMQFGISTDDSINSLSRLGDIAMGNKEKLAGLSLVFGQVASAGKLQGQDLMQFINQGFNPIQELTKLTGKSMAQLKDEMSKGKISFELVNKAIISATSSGGLFYQGMIKGSQTFSGKLSTMMDGITSVSEKIGTILLPHIEKFIIIATKAADSMGNWVEENNKLISSSIDKFIDILTNTINLLKIGMDTGLIPVIITMKLAFEAARLAVIAQTAATTAYTVIQSILDVGLIATTNLILAQNAAWLANPIGIVIVSLAALASAFYLVYTNIEIVDKWVSSLWNWFTELNIVLKILIGYLTLTGIVALIAFAPITATVLGVMIAIYALVKAYQYLKSKISGEPIETEIKEPEMPKLPGIDRPEPIPGMEAIDRKNQIQSANTGMLSQTINRNNNSNVVVDFKNLPQFANVQQKGMAPNVTVNTGKFVNPFAMPGFTPMGY